MNGATGSIGHFAVEEEAIRQGTRFERLCAIRRRHVDCRRTIEVRTLEAFRTDRCASTAMTNRTSAVGVSVDVRTCASAEVTSAIVIGL